MNAHDRLALAAAAVKEARESFREYQLARVGMKDQEYTVRIRMFSRAITLEHELLIPLVNAASLVAAAKAVLEETPFACPDCGADAGHYAHCQIGGALVEKP